MDQDHLQEMEKREREKIEKLFKANNDDVTLRKIFDEGTRSIYDCTLSSGRTTVLITEVKVRDHRLGKYPSTMIEEKKYNNIVGSARKLSHSYPDINFVGALITFFKGGQAQLHTFDDPEAYITEKYANKYTATYDPQKVPKRFVNFDIKRPQKIYLING